MILDESVYGDRNGGGIGYEHLLHSFTFEINKNGLRYQFKNDNKLVSEFRDKLLGRFIKTIESKLQQDDTNYPELKDSKKVSEILQVENLNNKGIYNLILRLTCGMYFTLLHGSNFIDYDILSISQYKKVMDKLWLNKWNINTSDSKIKPNTFIDMLSIDKNYWEEMCAIERESFMRNRIAFFVDYIEKDSYYRDMGFDPYLVRSGLWGEHNVIPAEKREAAYSTRDSKYGDSPVYSANKLQYIYRGRGNTGNTVLDSDSDDEGNEVNVKKKNIYCAEIDDSYELVDFKNSSEDDYLKKRAQYYHVYDDIIVPHLSSGSTWKYIDDEEHRVNTNEQTGFDDKEHKSNANIRFILYQDQINFIKYFVNLKIIPIYDYFDCFMDSFCMLASKIVDDQNYEIVDENGGRTENIYTSVDVLNFKAFYKLLESSTTVSNPPINLEEYRIKRVEEKYQKAETIKKDKKQHEEISIKINNLKSDAEDYIGKITKSGNETGKQEVKRANKQVKRANKQVKRANKQVKRANKQVQKQVGKQASETGKQEAKEKLVNLLTMLKSKRKQY